MKKENKNVGGSTARVEQQLESQNINQQFGLNKSQVEKS